MTAPDTWWGKRTWSPADASAALPLVRRIVDDLLACYARWRAAVDAFEYATGSTQAGAPNPEADRLMADAQALAGEIDALREELAQLDVRVVRIEYGVVAFRGERAGRVVPLYWVPGRAAPGYDWPDGIPANGTSTSWPSRAHVVGANRSRA